MGALKAALTPPSSYSAKKTDQWAELCDRIDGAFMPSQLDEFEAWMDARPLDFPGAYDEPLRERIEARRAELKAEDINQIVRDRFDFT